MNFKEIVHDNFKVVFSEPEVYVNNEKRGRSGHMTHAMTHLAPHTFIDFNSNCSPTRLQGHSAYGWVEYRISRDSGKTYSEPYTLPYSWESFLEGQWTVSVEKAVTCDDGTVVAFCLRNTMLEEVCCEPWLTPMCIRTSDDGQTWSEPYECIPYRGRIYDALYKDGVIYACIFCNEGFLGTQPEHVYRLYTSEDNGKSFQERCVIPFPDTFHRGYITLLFDTVGKLHAYVYNEKAEQYMDHAVSEDCGKTWEVTEPCYVAKGIRNPQTTLMGGVYFLHGRGGDGRNLVFYTSQDSVHWDEGIILGDKKGGCYYSNNIILRDEQGEFLLMQYSDLYDDTSSRVNAMHLKARIER